MSDDNLHLWKVEPYQIDSLWPVIKPFIERANAKTLGELGIKDILTNIKTRDAQCWIVFDDKEIKASMTTRVAQYPNKKILHLSQLGSDIPVESLMVFFDMITQWGKEEGCTDVRLEGRRGWLRKLKDWTELYTVMSRRIV